MRPLILSVWRQRGLLLCILCAAAFLVYFPLNDTVSYRVDAQSNDPPPAKLCFDMNFEDEGVVRSETGVYRNDLNCRLLVENSDYLYWTDRLTGVTYPITGPGNIGEQDVLSLGVVQAVDVFSPTGVTHFDNGVIICLKGYNQLLYTQMVDTPHQATDAPIYRLRPYKDYTCTTIFEPGMVIMIDKSVDLQPPPFDLKACQVKTNYVLHLRQQPNVKSSTLSYVPFNTTLDASAIQGGWYRVDYEGQTGWINGRGNYLTYDGTCGRVCEQNNAGTLLICRFASDDELTQLELQNQN